jgi:hypothetical protein
MTRTLLTTAIILSATTAYAQDSEPHPCIAYGETAARAWLIAILEALISQEQQ